MRLFISPLSAAEACDISIHAPVKGATPSVLNVFFHVNNFNPRTREGCDNGLVRYPRIPLDFNPRTREGCDERFGLFIVPGIHISIHAPVKGATSAEPADKWR